MREMIIITREQHSYNSAATSQWVYHAMKVGPCFFQVVDPPLLKMEGNTIRNGDKEGVTLSRKVYSGSQLLGYKKENFVVSGEKSRVPEVSGDGERLVGKESILKLIFGENGAPTYLLTDKQ